MQKGKDVEVSVPFHSATVETCVELVSSCPVVCQFVPMQRTIVFLSQETQAFQPQLRPVGMKVPRQACQGDRGGIC